MKEFRIHRKFKNGKLSKTHLGSIWAFTENDALKEDKLRFISPDRDLSKLSLVPVDSGNRRLTIEFTQERSGGEPLDPNEEWTSYSDEYISLHVSYLVRKEPDSFFPYKENIEVQKHLYEKEKLFLVVVRYTNGDTFGTRHGNSYFLKVADSRIEAEELKERVEYGKYEGYKPWKGYFESLEKVEIHYLDVVD